MKKYQHYIDALGGVLPTHLDLDCFLCHILFSQNIDVMTVVLKVEKKIFAIDLDQKQ